MNFNLGIAAQLMRPHACAEARGLFIRVGSGFAVGPGGRSVGPIGGTADATLHGVKIVKHCLIMGVLIRV